MQITNEATGFSYSSFRLIRYSRARISIIRQTVSILLFTIIAFFMIAPARSAGKPTPQKMSVSDLVVRSYGFYDTNGVTYDSKESIPPIALGEVATNSPGRVMCPTTLSFMHYGTMGRQVAHRGVPWVHFVWMYEYQFAFTTTRAVNYNAYNLSTCVLEGGISGWSINILKAGFCNIDVYTPTGASLPAAHEGVSPESLFSRVYYDFWNVGPSGLFYSDTPLDRWGWYLSDGTQGSIPNPNIWPKIAYQYGTEEVIHMVTTESGGPDEGPKTCSYYRKIGEYSPNWLWSDQLVIDTVITVSVNVIASTISDRVAIVWMAPCEYRRDKGFAYEFKGPWYNDLWVALSDNQGQEWVDRIGTGVSLAHSIDPGLWGYYDPYVGGNVTKFDSLGIDEPYGNWQGYNEVEGIFDTDDKLHLLFMCNKILESEGTIYPRDHHAAIFHWTEEYGDAYYRPVVVDQADIAEDNDICETNAWGLDLLRVSLAQCDGKLYAVWTQFGSLDANCTDMALADAKGNRYQNGELYMAVSPDNGMNWDRGQNLTNTHTPDCAAGDCESEIYATMPQRGRIEGCDVEELGAGDTLTGQYVLDVFYQNDRAPGFVEYGENSWTTNPMMWMRVKCRDAVVEPQYSDDAGGGYGECYSDEPLVMPPGGGTTVTVRMTNYGLADNNYSISYDYSASPYSDWIAATDPYPGFLPCCGELKEIEFQFNDPGAGDPEMLEATIIITHDAQNSPREIPICLLVSSHFAYLESAVISTACRILRIYNQGEMVNRTYGQSLDIVNDPDTFNINTITDVYLWDASPLILRVEGPDTLKFTDFMTYYTHDEGLRPQGPLETGTSDGYDWAYCDYATADMSIGIYTAWFAPTAEDTCEFVVGVRKFYNLSGSPMANMIIAEFIDWNIPSDSLARNGSNYLPFDNLIFQYGAEYDQDDSTEALGGGQEAYNRYGAFYLRGDGSNFKNMMTIDNATYVDRETSPHANAPLDPSIMYDMLSTAEGFTTYSTMNPDSIYTDISTVVTFTHNWGAPFTLGVNDTLTVQEVFITGHDYDVSYMNMKTKAEAYISNNPLFCVNDNLGCCEKPGDANNDGQTNIADPSYIINNIFFGGAGYACAAQADANADGSANIADASFIINWIFFGGNPPICPPE